MGSFKLGKMTLRSLFSKPETVMYPAQTRFQPEGLKGKVLNDIDTCILCGICEKRCPTAAISVVKKEGSGPSTVFDAFSVEPACVNARKPA